MRPITRRALFLTLLAAAGSACGGVFSHDDSGETRSVSLVTPLSVSDAHDRALAWFIREGYGLVDLSGVLVRADKQRLLGAGRDQQRDVQSVSLTAAGDGTRVTIDLITYLVENGVSRQAAQVSAEARQDAERLAQDLMIRP